MSLNVLFAASQSGWTKYGDALCRAFAAAGLDVDLRQEFPAPMVDYVVYAPSDAAPLDFSGFTRLKVVLALWAGVEQIVQNPTLKVPLTKMVETGLSAGMVEWVCGHVLRYHLGLDRHTAMNNRDWRPADAPLARDRRVGVLGLGELGKASARALSQLNFVVSGWARGPKIIDGVDCYHGPGGLNNILQNSEILVLLLPLTTETRNLLNAERLGRLPRGARILN
ncbi:MAG: NAD(P)-dependent oxidoreductase, partial [Paracoccaceae bacterium]